MMSFPPEFDPVFYQRTYNYPGKSDAELSSLFYNEGCDKGECGSPLSSTEGFLSYLAKIFAGRKILEIGPGFNPRFRGRNVYYFDVADSDGLRNWATSVNRSPANVPEEIHFVDQEGNLDIIHDKFDLVFSCHSIEHTANLIKHLNHVRTLLNYDGVYACIAPDRRFTFDFFRPESTFEEIVDQHFNRPDYIHPVQHWLARACLNTHNDRFKHWAGEHGAPRGHNFSTFYPDLQKYLESGKLDGGHRWVFTADSFRQICEKLAREGFISLELERVYNVPFNGNGFNALFTPKAPVLIGKTYTASQTPCNICGCTEYRTGPNGRIGKDGKLPDCMCCHSLERHRSARRVWDVLKPYMASFSALQISPDPSIPHDYFRKFEVSVYGGENHIDLENIDRTPGSYDMVLCNHVLEHVGDDNKAVNNLLRIIRHDGILAIAVPMHMDRPTNDWGFADPKLCGHYRIYGVDLWSRFKANFYALEVETEDPVTGKKDLMFFLTKEADRCRSLFEILQDKFPVHWKYVNNAPLETDQKMDNLVAAVKDLAGAAIASLAFQILRKRRDLLDTFSSNAAGLLFWLWQNGRVNDSLIRAKEDELANFFRWLHASSASDEVPAFSKLHSLVAQCRADLQNFKPTTREGKIAFLEWFEKSGKAELDLAEIAVPPAFDPI